MIVGLVAFNVAAQTAPSRPRLVVGIVVDQLRTDYIEYLQSCFTEGGFRKLMTDGAYMRDVDFKVNGLDKASATAMLLTGSYPARTGVPSAMIYDNTRRASAPALSDPKTLGNFTNDSYSPENLRLSTLSDELSIDGIGLSAIYSFAADPQQAIILAGHAGSGACWINTENGNWATTTYYKPIAAAISNRNYSAPIRSRIDTMQWKPLRNLRDVPGLPEQKKLYSFSHTFPRADRDVFVKFAASPMGNAEVTDAAINCLKSLKMGSNGNAVDMLNIGYTVAPYKYVSDGDYRAELSDTYIRLDRDLSRLFDAIEKYAGKDDVVIWLSSTGYYDDAVIDDRKYRIPGGEFSTKRAKSLLNAYLSAKHGNAGYVGAFKDGHLYFDHKVLDDKKLDLTDVVSDARSFLAKMSGVSDAYTLEDVLSPNTPEEEKMRLLIDPKRGGDIYVTFNPGWTVVEDIDYPPVSKPVRQSPILAPAFIMGGDVAQQVISTPVDATALAPTVAGVLRIRSPNGSESRPLPLIHK